MPVPIQSQNQQPQPDYPGQSVDREQANTNGVSAAPTASLEVSSYVAIYEFSKNFFLARK